MSQPGRDNATIPSDLADILHPVDADAFLQQTYGREFRLIKGTAGKFSGLLPWPVLNRILEEHRLEPPRLRLTREGNPVPPQHYLSWQSNRRKSGQSIPRLNSTALTAELRSGATLVLDAVDELHRPVRKLAESLERVFRVRVQVNSYAGWRTSHGFDLHWDDHDVFVLQIAGRKRWQVYGMTRPYPLRRDAVPTTERPTKVLWEGLLEDGDVLYIPRGWWHVAMPLDEPTLHLTVGVNNLTGADFLTWYADRMRRSEVVRQDIPHLEGIEARRAFSERLREAVLTTWDPDIVEEYLKHMDVAASSRAQFALPWTATPQVLPEGNFYVRWNGNRNLPVESTDAEVAVSTRGRRWRFAAAAKPILEVLMSGREVPWSELEREAELPSDTIREFVRELVTQGLVVVV